MRPSKVKDVVQRGLLMDKRVGIIGGAYILITLFCLLLLAGNMENPGIFDLIADLSGVWGSTNQNMFIVVAIPLIVTVIHKSIERYEKGFYVIKIGPRFRIWHSYVVLAVCLSFILTCLILAFSFLIGGLLVGTKNTWLTSEGTVSRMLNNKEHFQSILSHLGTYKIVLTLFITKFLGFLMISFLTLFLRQFVKSGGLVMVILIALAGIDFIPLPFPIFANAACLSLSNWVNPMITVYHCIYMGIVSLVLYGVTGLLYERKDFLS